MVWSKTSGFPVGVGGRGGRLWITFQASFEAASEVDQSSFTLAIVPSDAISIRNRTRPWPGPSTAVPIMLRTCCPQA